MSLKTTRQPNMSNICYNFDTTAERVEGDDISKLAGEGLVQQRLFQRFQRGLGDPVLFQIIEVFQEQQPEGLFGVIEFCGATGFLAENVINVFEGLFEHEQCECAREVGQRQSVVQSPRLFGERDSPKRKSGWSPIQNFQLHRAAAIELVDLRRERQIKFPDRQRLVAAIPPNRLVRHDTVGHPKFDVLFVRTDALERTRVGEIARAELHAGIPLPRRFQTRQLVQHFKIHFVQADFRIEAQ
jgi:hypothetical protein